MTSKTEAAVIRSQLKLRIRPNLLVPEFPVYEVWTTIHGSGVFKWLIISKSDYDWYKKTFPNILEEHHDQSLNHC